MESENLTVAAIFKSPVEANIAMGMLRSNGIPCVLNGEIANSVLGIQLGPSDGIRLLVYEKDLDEAQRLLKRDDD